MPPSRPKDFYIEIVCQQSDVEIASSQQGTSSTSTIGMGHGQHQVYVFTNISMVQWLTRWSRSMKLLNIRPGYYLDGWLSVDRWTVSVRTQPPGSTQPFIPSGLLNQVPACLAGVRWGVFTCVRWKVTLCDPIWQVMPRSSKMTCSGGELYHLTFIVCHQELFQPKFSD